MNLDLHLERALLKGYLAFLLAMLAVDIALLAGPFLLLIYQAAVYAKTAEWPHFAFGALWDWFDWPKPATEWLGVQQMLDGLLTWPLGLVSFLVGVGLFFVLMKARDAFQAASLDLAERQKRGWPQS